MKIGERGQVTMPKDLLERFGLKPETEVEFQVVNNSILLRKKPGKLNWTRWKGRCRKSFKELGYTRVDEFIEDVRGWVKGKVLRVKFKGTLRPLTFTLILPFITPSASVI